MEICKEFIGKKTKILICREGAEIFDITNPDYKEFGSGNALNIRRTENNQLVGYIKVALRPDEYWSEFETKESNLYWRPDIVGFHIDPKFRDEDFGSDALKTIVRWAKESGFSGIDGNEVVMDENLEQRLRFLKRNGFECDEDRYGLYSCAINF